MKIGKIKNLTMQQQVQLNTDNIEQLARVIKNIFNTQETLTTASTTIDTSNIVDWDTNATTGLILSKDGLLFDIVAVVDSTVYIKYWASVKGPQGPQGETGATGNGIASVEKTGTSGLVDTYTITFTNGQTTTFTVTNGQDGTNGTNGQDGADFTALTYKGQWISGTDYNKFDLVYVEANSVRTFYMSLNNIVNSTVSPDLDTTNFKEMFEIPVSSTTVQSKIIASYTDFDDIYTNNHIPLYAEVENISGYDINVYQTSVTFAISGGQVTGASSTSNQLGLLSAGQKNRTTAIMGKRLQFADGLSIQIGSTSTIYLRGVNSGSSSAVTSSLFTYKNVTLGTDIKVTVYYI